MLRKEYFRILSRLRRKPTFNCYSPNSRPVSDFSATTRQTDRFAERGNNQLRELTRPLPAPPLPRGSAHFSPESDCGRFFPYYHFGFSVQFRSKTGVLLELNVVL